MVLSRRSSTPTLFVTGTDTGVGKTVFSVLLTRHLIAQKLSVTSLKPVCSGGREDALTLQTAQVDRLPLDIVNPWHYPAPIAPILAARRQRRPLHLASVLAHIRGYRRQADWLLVEGAGGLLSPLGEGFDSRDLIVALRATPFILVPNQLGAVGQARLALAALPPSVRQRSWIVLNRPDPGDHTTRHNAALLRECAPGTMVIELPPLHDWQAATIRLPRAITRQLQPLLNRS